MNCDLIKLEPGNLPTLEGYIVLPKLEGLCYYSSILMVGTSSCFNYIKGHDESNVKMADGSKIED